MHSLHGNDVRATSVQMSKLRCFMYVSTAYSNAHVCHGSMITLKEELYSLPDERGMPLDHAAYVKHLLALDPQAAQQEVGNNIFQILCACPCWFLSCLR